LASNVIEIVLRVKDQASTALKSAISNISGLGLALGGLATGLVFRKIIQETQEAQQATQQLRNALRLLGDQAGVNEKSVSDFSDQLQRTTIFSDEAAKEATTLAIRLGITGDVLQRVVKDASDLASATGGDLVGATQQLARALADPERGMLSLRRSGIVLSESQRKLIKDFSDVGDKASAQEVILKAVERSYKGAAQAATGTLGGALKQLQNAFGDLFEQTEGQTSSLTESIQSLTETLRNPEIKAGIDALASAMTAFATAMISVLAHAPDFIKFLAEATAHAIGGADTQIGQLNDQLDEIEEKLANNRKSQFRFGVPENKKLKAQLEQQRIEILAEINRIQTDIDKANLAAQRAAAPAQKAAEGRPTTPSDNTKLKELLAKLNTDAVKDFNQGLAGNIEETTRAILDRDAKIKEIIAGGTEAAKEAADAISAYYDQINKDTETSLESQARAYREFEQKVGDLVDKGTIDPATAKKRLDEFKTTQSGAYKEVAESARRATEQIHDAFTNLFLSIGQGGAKGFAKSLVDTIRQMMANILATITLQVLGIEKLMKRLATSIGGTGGGSGNTGAIAAGIGALFGFAGGGRPRGLAVVGENGPELADFGGGGKVWNKNMLAFAGGGGVTFNSPTTINVNAGTNASPEQIAAAVDSRVALATSKSQRDTIRLLERNGFGRLR
jgi:phage-related minor tail protein